MTEPRAAESVSRPPNVPRLQLFTSLKAEMLLSLAVLGTAALSLAALDVVVLHDLVASSNGALYLALLIIADVLVFVAFGAYKLQGLVLDPLETVVETTEAIASGDLSRRVPPGRTTEFARLARSVNRMTSRLLEEQAQRAHLEKVASVGRLAAGVAHEVGNPLGAIAGYAHLLRASVNGDADAADALAGIERESARIDRIVRGMLDFARPRRRVTERVDVNAAIHGVAAMLRDQGALRRVELRMTLHPALPAIVADAHEIDQVLVNLLLNAVDAMDGHGAVSILTDCHDFADIAAGASRRKEDPDGFAVMRDQSARVSAWLAAAGDVRRVVKLVVSDTGPGIPWSDTERIFDPFFTTKEPGKGTGLGLAVVSRVVEGHGGTIWVRQAREGGAAFVIYLPVPAEVAAVPAPDEP